MSSKKRTRKSCSKGLHFLIYQCIPAVPPTFAIDSSTRSDVDKLRSQLKEEMEAPYIQQIREYESKAEKANQGYMELRRKLQSTKDESERALQEAKRTHEREREEYEQQASEFKEQLARLRERVEPLDGQDPEMRLRVSLKSARSSIERLTSELNEVHAAKGRLTVKRINSDAESAKERSTTFAHFNDALKAERHGLGLWLRS